MPPKKEEPKKDMVVEFGFVIVICIFLIIVWSAILNYLFFSRFGSYGALWQSLVAWFLLYIWPIIIIISILLSIIAIIGIVRNYRRLKRLNKEERRIYGPTPEAEKAVEPVTNKNSRWEHALAHLNSANASDWRLSLIEADVMLDEILRAQGYHGDSIGDMLKGVEPSDMTTLDSAWEAHKVRNQIVHSGTDYYLTEREAKRVMGLYESVFREFKVI